MDAYDNFNACAAVDRVRRRPEQLVRPPQPRPLLEQRARRRQERRLLDALRVPVDHRKLIAPFVPFLAEALWQNLAVARLPQPAERPSSRSKASTSATIPTGDAAAIDEALSARMAPGPRDRLAGPQRPDGREAQGPPAAGPGRGRSWPTARTRPGWKSTPR